MHHFGDFRTNRELLLADGRHMWCHHDNLLLLVDEWLWHWRRRVTRLRL